MGRLLDRLRRMRASLALEGAFAVVAAVVVLLVPGDAHGTAQVELSRAAGTLSLANSRAGAAIFQAANMRPGEEASGTVRVTNTGTLGSTLALAPTGAPQAGDAPGRALAARLRLVVVDVTDSTRPTTVYSGPLAAMPAVGLGALGAGAGRDFVFVASVPAGTPASDNLLQGGTLAVGFTWTATAASTDSPPPAPTPTVTPPATATPTPGPAPTVTPTPAPPSGTCAPRTAKIRIRSHGRRILKVTVKVGARRAKRVKPRAAIKVKVTGPAAAKVRVTATLAGGKRVVATKRVRGC